MRGSIFAVQEHTRPCWRCARGPAVSHRVYTEIGVWNLVAPTHDRDRLRKQAEK